MHAQPGSIEASVAAADTLHKVLEAHADLQADPTEAALKQFLALLQQAAPQLQEACWLLVTQHKSVRSEVCATMSSELRTSLSSCLRNGGQPLRLCN